MIRIRCKDGSVTIPCEDIDVMARRAANSYLKRQCHVDRESAAQEAWVSMLRTARSGDCHTNPRGLLNLCAFRSAKRTILRQVSPVSQIGWNWRLGVNFGQTAQPITEGTLGTTESADVTIWRSELLTAVRAASSHFKNYEAGLAVMGGQKTGDVAETAGVSVAALYSLVNRMKHRLQQIPALQQFREEL